MTDTYSLLDRICGLVGHRICSTDWGQRLFAWAARRQGWFDER